MHLGNVRNQCFAVLEQACMRYAIMSFETLNKRIALDLKSIRYTYKPDNASGDSGTFAASFTPWRISDQPMYADRVLTVTWRIRAHENDRWLLADGMASVQGISSPYRILWGAEVPCMIFRCNGAVVRSIYAEHCETFGTYKIV
jgi:hypothetical protein